MKKRTLLILCLAGTLVVSLTARAQQPTKQLLGEQVIDNTRIARYEVTTEHQNDYAVLYRINLSNVEPQWGKNGEALQAIDQLLQRLTSDTTRHILGITISGYASPDGPQALNQRLAQARAEGFVRYGDQALHLRKLKSPEVKFEAESWRAIRTAVANSAVPDKEALLQLLDSDMPNGQKEPKIKAMPAAWEYLKEHILPQHRRVEVRVCYAQSSILEERTPLAPPPVAAPQPKAEAKPHTPSHDPCDPCACEVVDEGITGILVAWPDEEPTPHHKRHRRHR